MDKEWVTQKRKEYKNDMKMRKRKIRDFIIQSKLIEQSDKNVFIKYLNDAKRNPWSAMLEWKLKSYLLEKVVDGIKIENKDFVAFKTAVDELKLDEYYSRLRFPELYSYTRYLDSELTEFDGDIIITDPCYILKEDSDWDKCSWGSDMEAIGIYNYITRETLCGDWICATFNSDTGEEIGGFSADAGLVSVFLLDEVLNYNPNFNYHIDKTWTTTLIKDFKGTVQIIIKYIEGVYEHSTEYYKAGDKWVNYFTEVVGHGVNKKTGENINFVGKQADY